MSRKLILLCSIAGLLVAGFKLQAGTPKTETVSYKSGSDTLSGYIALPSGEGKHPAVLVIHEFWGLNDWVKESTQKFAEQGYVALAVDLYRGKVTKDANEAHELMRGLPDDRAARDLEAAFTYLASRADVNPEKIASVGWCMGGSLSIKLAETEPKLAACIVNYGALPSDAATVQNIKAPVLGNFGADDRGITPDSVRAFESAMKSQGKSVDIKIYPGAGHAFENPDNKDGYRPEAAADAWKRMTAFFKEKLK